MYEPFEIIRVPFPYSDLDRTKNRPSLVLSAESSFNRDSNHVVIAMITTARHSSFPLDVPIHHWQEVALPCPCLVRMKLFTIDKQKIIRREGTLHPADKHNVIASLQKLLPTNEISL